MILTDIILIISIGKDEFTNLFSLRELTLTDSSLGNAKTIMLTDITAYPDSDRNIRFHMCLKHHECDECVETRQ